MAPAPAVSTSHVKAPGGPSCDLQAHLGALKRTMAVDRVLSVKEAAQPTLATLCVALTNAVDAPRAMLALVTGHQDLYPVHQGFAGNLPPHPHQAGPTLCHHVIAQGQTLLLEDTRAHAPYNEVGSVVHGGVHAYLGAPVWFEGQVVGSLCVVDGKPRPWTDEQRTVVEMLASSVSSSLEAAWKHNALVAEHDSLAMRMSDLEEGVVTRQLAFRDVAQGLHMLQNRIERLPLSAHVSSLVALCEDLHDKLRETNQGVLASLALPGHTAASGNTSWAELLALAVVALQPSRVAVDDASGLGADASGSATADVALSRQQVKPRHQASVLKTLVSAFSECLVHLLPAQTLQVRSHSAGAVTASPHELAKAQVMLELSAPEGIDLRPALASLKGLFRQDIDAGRLALAMQGSALWLTFND